MRDRKRVSAGGGRRAGRLRPRPTQARLRRCAAVAGVAAAALALGAAPGLGWPGTGFNGELYYGGPGFQYLGYQWTPENHSYGFNSARNLSGGNVYVSAAIKNLDNGQFPALGSGFDLVRVCVHGTYPNCVDTDGWTGSARIQHNDSSKGTITLEGHGVF